QVPAIFEANSGVFPFGGASSIGSMRMDANLSDTRSLSFRFNMGQQDLQNTRFGAQTGYTRGNSTGITSGTALAGYTQRFNPHRSNGFLNSSRDGGFTFGEVLPLGLVLGGIDPLLPGRLAASLNALGGPSLAARLNDPLNSLQAYALGLPVGYLQTFGRGV